ncbi:MAG: universal stress protein, partial [Bacteroidota bacterium]
MKKILVPVDFSDNARNAFTYAQELALYLDADIKVVHFAHPSVDPVNPYLTVPTDAFPKHKVKQLKEFVSKAMEPQLATVLTEANVQQEVELGFAAEDIVRYTKSGEFDLVVMGTTGAGGVINQVFGSVSSHVSQHAACPVLFVPADTPFRDFDNILYASNYHSADDDVLRQITDFAGLFPANIHLVHVNETKKKGDYQFEEHLLEQIFRKKAPELEFRMVTVQSENAWTGLRQYARENGVDLIVLASLHRNFWQRLWHKSV